MSHPKNSNQDAVTANGLEYKIIRKKFYNQRARDSGLFSFPKKGRVVMVVGNGGGGQIFLLGVMFLCLKQG